MGSEQDHVDLRVLATRPPPPAPHQAFRAGKVLLLVSLIVWWSLGALPVEGASTSGAPTGGYGGLIDFIATEALTDPLLTFSSGIDFDARLNRQNIAFLKNNPALLQTIRAQLPGGMVHWELTGASKQLLVVPETRPAYAALFEQYCREAVAFVLRRLQLRNPYRNIVTLTGTPPFDPPCDSGITVYLVHNIADDYTEEYTFFTPSSQDSQIRVRLANRAFSGRIGAYTSRLVMVGDHPIFFERDAYTIWRNSARNALNVFLAPIEETLHIALRQATENAIISRLEHQDGADERQAAREALVLDWMAAEEAVVGGLLVHLLPEMLGHLIPVQVGGQLEEALALREQLAQYQYLAEGIRLVGRLGLQHTMACYHADPGSLLDLLRQPPLKAAAAASAHHARIDDASFSRVK